MMFFARTVTTLFLLSLVACGYSETTALAAPVSSDDNKGPAEPKKRKARVKKDRGDASVTIGDTLWEAKRASAKLKNGVLTITASRMDFVGKRATRQQVTLVIADYKGPGKYKVRSIGSVFLGVGLDTDKLEAANTDKKVEETAIKAIKKSSIIPLMNATAEIASDDGKQLIGTFSQPALGKRLPALEKGTFRALIKQAKSRQDK